jgi:transposase-like protein
MGDYRAGRRVSLVVDCSATTIPHDVRDGAVQTVFDRQVDLQTQWLTFTEVAGELGLVPQALRFWVRERARRTPS